MSSCCGTKLSSSPIRTSASNHSVTKGHIRCVWKSGIPYFLFTVCDDRSKVYLSSCKKIETSAKALDYIYLFLSRSNGEVESINVSRIVGKMKVSNYLTVDSNGSKISETEFALFYDSKELPCQVPISAHKLKMRKGLLTKMADGFKSHKCPKIKSTRKLNKSNNTELYLDSFIKYKELDLVELVKHDCSPNLELTSIIIKDHQQDYNRKPQLGGWGLKFLEKANSQCNGSWGLNFLEKVNVQGNSSSEPEVPITYLSSGKCHTDTTEMPKQFTVIIPTDFHTSPSPENGCPSSLIDRWRSGGCCDCGGWDVGCPLKVFSSNILNVRKEEHKHELNSVEFYLEGMKNDEPTLKMIGMKDGTYSIYFEFESTTLAALQSFAIAVAIIHSQIASLHPQI